MQSTFRPSPLTKSAIWAAIVATGIGLLTVAAINVRPYINLYQDALNVSFLADFQWLLKMVQGGWSFLALCFGLATYAIFQFFQCLWIVIKFDAKAQASAMIEARKLSEQVRNAATKQALADGVITGDEQKHIDRVSRIPMLFMRYPVLFAIGSYLLDVAIGYRQYPIWSSWTSFTLWLKTPSPAFVNQDNLIYLPVMLFSFEAVLIVFLCFWQWKSHHNR